MSAVLEVHDAHKRFGDIAAVTGASFALRRGELLALVGPNGAGKSTLVRAIAGRVRLDSGSVSLDGERLDAGARQARRRLGIVPQNIALYPMLTATENLQAFAALNGLAPPRREQQVRWALDWTGLGERAAEPISQFSGGMQRRLNIACGILHEPQVIILDEPTVGVDPQSRQRIWDMLAQLRAQGASLLLTTHQLEEAQQLCERIVIIDHGTVVAAGTLDELIRQTVGAARRITIRLGAAAPAQLRQAGFELIDEGVVRHSVNDIAAELPALLNRIAASGAEICDLAIEAPSLQAAFLHLTGRELRD